MKVFTTENTEGISQSVLDEMNALYTSRVMALVQIRRRKLNHVERDQIERKVWSEKLGPFTHDLEYGRI